MTNERILQIIREETAYQEGVLFEGMTYVPQKGYRNNQLIYESNNQKLLLTEGWLETTQSILDWAGVIPFVGDILDGLNGVLYFLQKKWAEGAFSLISMVPVAGSLIGIPFRALFRLVKGPMGKLITAIKSGGGGAAKIFLDIVSTSGGQKTIAGGKKVQELMTPIFKNIFEYSNRIADVLKTVNLKAVNASISKYTWGWLGMPSSFVKMGQSIVNGFIKFFAEIGTSPEAYKTAQNAAEALLGNEIFDDSTEKTKEVDIHSTGKGTKDSPYQGVARASQAREDKYYKNKKTGQLYLFKNKKYAEVKAVDRVAGYKKYIASLGKKYKILRTGAVKEWGKSRYALYNVTPAFKDWHFICPKGVDGRKNHNKACGKSKPNKEFANGLIQLSKESKTRKNLENYMSKQKKA